MATITLVISTAALEHFIPGFIESLKWSFAWMMVWAIIYDVGNWS